jgi:hypothetical protein
MVMSGTASVVAGERVWDGIAMLSVRVSRRSYQTTALFFNVL